MVVLTFIIVLTVCSKKQYVNYNKILIEKRVDSFNQYEIYKEILDKNMIENISKIIENIKWENAKVCMTSPPHYKLYFENKNLKSKSNKKVYEVWINPKKEQLELVLESESKYAQLNKEESNEFLDIIINLRYS